MPATLQNTLSNLQHQAQHGDVHAAAQLGVYYLLGHGVEEDVERGFLLIKQTAEAGAISSQTLLATLYASGMGTEENWEKAYDWLVVAAQNRDPKAIMQIVYFVPEAKEAGNTLTWQDVRSKLSIADSHVDLDYTVHHTSPLIRSRKGFLDQRTCDYVMAVAGPLLRQAEVNDKDTGTRRDQSRTNSAASFYPLDNDLVIQKINKKIATFLGHPLANGEAISVLHYAPGQSYKNHHDFFNPDFPAHVPHLEAQGQRIKTFLIYLNDDYEGGTTNFPELAFDYKGTKGEALVFDNVTADGELLQNSLHAGMPPISGSKWIMSKWLKDKPQY